MYETRLLASLKFQNKDLNVLLRIENFTLLSLEDRLQVPK